METVAEEMRVNEFANHLILRVENDFDVEDPCEWDCQWRHVSFGRRHKKYEDPSEYFPLSIGLRAKLRVGTAFVLSYYEHGQGQWSLQGTGIQCRFDSVDVAGLLLWEHSPKDMGAKTYGERAQDARNFLEAYNAWWNGEGMYYSLETHDGETLDSCGGFLSVSHMVSDSITPEVYAYMAKHGFTKIRQIDSGAFDPEEDNAPGVLYVEESTPYNFTLKNPVNVTAEKEAA